MERGVQQRRKTPSFSSSLLDSVLRSIDESSDEGQQLLISKKQGGSVEEEEEEIASARRAVMIEKWMRKQSGGSSVNSVLFNSGSSSSESSSGGIFSSSEAETSSGGRSCFTLHRSKYVLVAASTGSKRSGKVADLAEQRDSAPTGGEARRSRRRRQLHEDEIESSDTMIN